MLSVLTTKMNKKEKQRDTRKLVEVMGMSVTLIVVVVS